MNFNTSMKELKGIGDKNGALFHKLNIDTVGDLLQRFPRAYESYGQPVSLNAGAAMEKAAIKGEIATVPVLTRVKGYQILRFVARDQEGNPFHVRIFNMPYLKKTLVPGNQYVFYGKVITVADHLQMDQPKMYKPGKYQELTKGYTPIYVCTKGLSNDTIRKYVAMGLRETKSTLSDPIPEEIICKRGFPHYGETLETIHNPESMDALYGAKKRIAYEEFFYFLLSTRQNQTHSLLKTEENRFIPCAQTNRLMEALPFSLTASQQKAWKEIEDDLYSGTICNRLLQGDVGCGKTMIAVLALLSCVSNGKQGAFMAPTEVLATQHFKLIEEMTREYDLPFRPVLLTGSIGAKDKRAAYEEIASGSKNLVIGTHALLEEGVRFQNLGLAVTDEQHRFGVRQRTVLTGKGKDVHTIVMSATPIPRSLAMILYGGLSVSTIPELPSNRIPIKNAVVDTRYRQTAYKFMKDEIAKGRQVYIICPMVESGIMEELENVEDYSEKLKNVFDDTIRIVTLHGKMKGAEKNRIMEEFSAGNYDILVSTTVIEVGINVPNATVMMIENAERFGLAALHQLRGRVGRGSHQSYCIFVDSTGNDKSKKRLEILGKTNDGFEIANADLKMRGPGEMSGTLQSGDTGFVYADIYDDADMLYLANEDVEGILKEDPDLESPCHALLKEKWQDVMKNGYLHTI
ncbi:MAG: ATP-dependent DNA helicase RecG [Lachnospiraceae bacterium]|nr:ATP-dependent DNA helicase RecG [Lachnospiraceae bacterium]